MATPFLSSEEYDDRAHQLYNDGQYDDALTVLREGLTLYPSAVELHVGAGYAQLAREEFEMLSSSDWGSFRSDQYQFRRSVVGAKMGPALRLGVSQA